jgi:tripartite-type tricarboxylate transporter receptor subunit TctC
MHMSSGKRVARDRAPMKLGFAALVCAAMLSLPAAHAQTQFPVKPIRLIVGSAAGSGPDIIGRAMADRLGETWGQRMIVDPRPGAAGAISADLALASAPDGYTMMMLTSQLFVDGEPANAGDFLWRQLSATQRTALAMKLQPVQVIQAVQTAQPASEGSLRWQCRHLLVVPA